MSSFQIPLEVINKIFYVVNPFEDFFNLLLVCKSLNSIITNHELYKLLQQFYNITDVYHSDKYNDLFIKACAHNIPLYSYLITYYQKYINIHAGNEDAFRLSCNNGHLNVALWLIELSQSNGYTLIDIHV